MFFSWDSQSDANDSFTVNNIAHAYPGGVPWRRPNSYSRWSIEFRRFEKGETMNMGKRGEKRVTLRQYGGDAAADFSQEIEFEDGERAETWVSRTKVYHSRVGDEGVGVQMRDSEASIRQNARAERVINPGGSETPPPEWENWRTLSDWEWVRPQCFDSVRKLRGEDILIFIQMTPEMRVKMNTGELRKNKRGPLGVPLVVGVKAAGVLESSRLPWILQDGQEIRTYEFKEELPSTMELPQKVCTFVARIDKAVRGGLNQSVRPY